MNRRNMYGLGSVSVQEAQARQELASRVVQLTAKAAEYIDYLLANEVTLLSAINRGIVFIPTALEARDSLKRAKKDLFEKFRPIALAAIEDPTRNLADIQDAVEGYLNSLEQQYRIVLQINDNHGLTGMVKQAFADIQVALSKGADILNPTKSWVPWALGAGAALTLIVLLRR